MTSYSGIIQIYTTKYNDQVFQNVTGTLCESTLFDMIKVLNKYTIQAQQF